MVEVLDDGVDIRVEVGVVDVRDDELPTDERVTFVGVLLLPRVEPPDVDGATLDEGRCTILGCGRDTVGRVGRGATYIGAYHP